MFTCIHRKRGTIKLVSALLDCFFTLMLLAPLWSQGSKDSIYHKNISLEALPVLYYTPETRFSIGGFANAMFRLNKNDSVSRKSNAQSYISFTQNKQFSIENDFQLFIKNEQYIITGTASYTRFPELFFGIGNNTLWENQELFSFDLIHIYLKANKKLYKGLFVGLQYESQNLYHIIKHRDMKADLWDIPGSKGFLTSGLGFTFLYDTRNNVLNATKGNYAELIYVNNSTFTGSSHTYQTYIIDLRNYFTIYKHYVLALHSYGNFNEGIVPFRAMPALGGARYLRGYYRGRYRDNHSLVLQAELRSPVFWRFSIAAFGGIGQVANEIHNLSIRQFKYNFGGGLRYLMNKTENVNIRLDIGFTKTSYGIYLVFAEAF